MNQLSQLPSTLKVEGLIDEFDLWDSEIIAANPLSFLGYREAVEDAQLQTSHTEAVVTGRAVVDEQSFVLIASDFAFLAGSMGVAVGERVARAFERALDLRLPVVTLLSSGGARMQEGIVSLTQMAKTVATAQAHSAHGLAQITICQHPTTGGMFASFGMQADLLIGEPGATIAFAGPRVAKAALGREMRPDSQTAEAALVAGQLDAVQNVQNALLTSARFMRALTPAATKISDPGSFSTPEISPWDVVLAARAPERPSGRIVVDQLFTDVVCIRGDRTRGHDCTMLAGFGRLHGRPVAFIAQDRHAGSGRTDPAGSRLAQRLAKSAERLGVPILTFIDTLGANPNEDSEHSGLVSCISNSLAQFLQLKVPVITVCIGEGSGSAFAFTVADRVLVQQTAIFSVIPPEGAAAILYRNADAAADVADALKISAPDLLDLGYCDRIAPDDIKLLGQMLASELDQLQYEDQTTRLKARLRRWRSSGNQFLA